ncbi:hypothetical protein QTP88_011841 [Uroleucon formosanum]
MTCSARMHHLHKVVSGVVINRYRLGCYRRPQRSAFSGTTTVVGRAGAVRNCYDNVISDFSAADNCRHHYSLYEIKYFCTCSSSVVLVVPKAGITDREDNHIMAVSETCNCQVRWVVGHFHWLLQDYGANGLWSERLSSAHYEHTSSSEEADRGESPCSINNDDEHGRFYGGWTRGRVEGWNGRRGCRLDDRRNGWRDGGLVGWRTGGLFGWRTGGWDGTPRSSFRRTPTRILCYWEKCCQWYAPNRCEGCYTTVMHAIHHEHNGYVINGSSDSGGSNDRGQTDRRRTARSFRRHRRRVVRGTEWF